MGQSDIAATSVWAYGISSDNPKADVLARRSTPIYHARGALSCFSYLLQLIIGIRHTSTLLYSRCNDFTLLCTHALPFGSNCNYYLIGILLIYNTLIVLGPIA